MKKHLTIIVSLLSLFSIAGCSTMVHDSKQNVAVHTMPEGADVLLDGQQQIAPTVFKVKGSSGYNVVANKNGYKPAHARVDGKFRFGSTIFGNILWLIPGVIVDIATGAAYEMQDQVTIPLLKDDKK